MELAVAGRKTFVYTGSRPMVAGQPALVFIHGAAQDHSCWTLQSRWFAHHGYSVVVPDLPGHGRSEGPPLATVEGLAAWLLALLDSLALGRAILVGHSMGSLVALETAARHPGRVTRLALIGSAAPMPVADLLLDAAATDEARARGMVNAWSHSARGQTGGNTVPGMWMLGSNLRLMERQPPQVLHNDLAACNAYLGAEPATAAVACPTLVVSGSRDRMSGAKGARALAAAIRGARLTLIEGGGHALMAERPDAVLDALRDFIPPDPDREAEEK